MTAGELTIAGLVKVYAVDDQGVAALQGLDLSIAAGERVGIVGASGSGKSTLLRLIAGFERPTSGSVRVGDVDVHRATARDLERLRRERIGIVWQQPRRGLIAHLSIVDNVELAARLAGVDVHADRLVQRVGLAGRRDVRIDRLSGGEVQRAAIAVALAAGPSLLIADEPTAELDRTSARQVFELLTDLSDLGATQLIVSHDEQLAEHADRVIRVRDGRIAEEERGGSRTPLLVVDRVGRVQLPDALRSAAGIESRVRASRDGRGVVLEPADGEDADD